MSENILEIDRDKDKERFFPMISKPGIFGYFSLDEDRNYVPDTSRLKYAVLPRNLRSVRLDLNANYGTAKQKTEAAHHEKLDHLLRFILNHATWKYEYDGKQRMIDSHFVCFRGLLTTVMITPFNEREEWIILASYWRGTIYLCAQESEEKKQARLNATEKLKRFQSWGFKFEQYVLSDNPHRLSDTSKPVVETEEFCCVFKTLFNQKNLLYGAEMDGVISKHRLPERPNLHLHEFIELKTNRHIESRNQDYNFRRFKLLKWWCQCFLVSIERIFCGYRDDNGVVERIREHRVQDLSTQTYYHNMWDPTVCMNFLDDFLKLVQRTVTENDPNIVWRFEYQPKINKNIVTYRRDNDSKNVFLPEWYIRRF